MFGKSKNWRMGSQLNASTGEPILSAVAYNAACCSPVLNVAWHASILIVLYRHDRSLFPHDEGTMCIAINDGCILRGTEASAERRAYPVHFVSPHPV